MTYTEALNKVRKFCAYQERSQKEVRNKLVLWGLPESLHDGVIAELLAQNYLNELRYAKAFISGKYNIKSWGRQKIRAALKFQGLSEECISRGMQSVDFSDYGVKLKKLADKWVAQHKEADKSKMEYKLRLYLYSKGYERQSIDLIIGDIDF